MFDAIWSKAFAFARAKCDLVAPVRMARFGELPRHREVPDAIVASRRRANSVPASFGSTNVQIAGLWTDQSYLIEPASGGTAADPLGSADGSRRAACSEKASRLARSSFRSEVRPFTEKQIELVKNFAGQAVIAIENARLLTSCSSAPPSLPNRWSSRRRRRRCFRSSAALRAISQPVFETMLENAVRICDAKFGNIYPLGW